MRTYIFAVQTRRPSPSDIFFGDEKRLFPGALFPFVFTVLASIRRNGNNDESRHPVSLLPSMFLCMLALRQALFFFFKSDA